MAEPHMVRVLGRSAFHDISLTVSGHICYLGGEWRRDVAFAGFEVAIQIAVSAEKLIFGVGGVDPKRRAELIDILDIDLSWKMQRCLMVREGECKYAWVFSRHTRFFFLMR